MTSDRRPEQHRELERRLRVEASLWFCDLTMLGAEVARLGPHIDALHIDAGDGHMPGRPLFFPALLATLRPAIRTRVHVHLMAWNGLRLALQWTEAGADIITVHAHADDTADALQGLRDEAPGVTTGVALTRDLPVTTVEPFLDAGVGFVVSVNTPLDAFDAHLDQRALHRLCELRALVDRRHRHLTLLADGGVHPATVAALADAGADAVVAGSLLRVPAADVASYTRWIAAGGRDPLPPTTRPELGARS